MAGARALLRKTVGSLHLMHLTTNDSKEKPRSPVCSMHLDSVAHCNQMQFLLDVFFFYRRCNISLMLRRLGLYRVSRLYQEFSISIKAVFPHKLIIWFDWIILTFLAKGKYWTTILFNQLFNLFFFLFFIFNFTNYFLLYTFSMYTLYKFGSSLAKGGLIISKDTLNKDVLPISFSHPQHNRAPSHKFWFK